MKKSARVIYLLLCTMIQLYGMSNIWYPDPSYEAIDWRTAFHVMHPTTDLGKELAQIMPCRTNQLHSHRNWNNFCEKVTELIPDIKSINIYDFLQKIQDLSQQALDALLLIAARKNAHTIMENLLHCGANVNTSTTTIDFFGNTPLHFAITIQNNERVLKTLLAAGASLKAKNRDGSTPLKLAEKIKRYDNTRIVQQFILSQYFGMTFI